MKNVSTNTSSMEFMFIDFTMPNGLLFDSGNSAALANQLTRFMDEPGLAIRLSGNAQHPESTASYVDALLGAWGGR